VWRLWQELSAEYPGFEFHHSNGLGILGVGPQQPPALLRLYAAQEHEGSAARVRRLFAARGETFRLLVATAEQQARLDGLLAERERLGAVHGELAAREDELRRLTEECAAAQERAAALARQGAAARTRAEEKTAEVARLAAALAAKEREAGRHAAKLAAREQAAALALHQARLETRATREQVTAEFHASTSWRLTAPVRAVARLMQRPSSAAGARSSALDRLGGIGRRLRRPASVPPAPAPDPADATALAAAAEVKAALRAGLAAQLDTFLAGSGRLCLPASTRPDISIILVLYNQAELTYG